MAQQLRALTAPLKCPEFNSQQPQGGSQPSVMGSGALLWCVRGEPQCTHIHKINQSLKKKRKAERELTGGRKELAERYEREETTQEGMNRRKPICAELPP